MLCQLCVSTRVLMFLRRLCMFGSTARTLAHTKTPPKVEGMYRLLVFALSC